MDALVPAFVAAALGEVGDKTQMLTILLAARYARPAAVLGGVAVAALANSLVAATGGWLIADRLTPEASGLLLALALLSAAVTGFLNVPNLDASARWKLGAFAGSAVAFFVVEFGDRTQFVTAAIATRSDSLAMAALGATAGILIVNAPAALLGRALADAVPLAPFRRVISVMFLLAGLLLALSALRLI